MADIVDTKTSMLGNRFRVIGTLGKGATAYVLHAHDTIIDRPVAIKLPHHNLLKKQPALTKMFLKEAKYLSSFCHPHILPLYDYFDSPQGPVLVTRYVQGALDRVFHKQATNIADTIDAAHHIASSIDFCNSKGVIHRDITPRNVLLDENGNTYLTDFGIAAKIDDDRKWKEVVGTPPFVSPELLFEKKLSPEPPQRGRADQFSFGVLLFWMLTGHLPFEGPTKTKIPSGWENCTAWRLWAHEPLVRCSERNQSLPVSVDDVLFRMMHIDPKSRFNSNLEAVKSLAGALEGNGGLCVFISFSHADAQVVAPIIEKLKSMGTRIWWDKDIVHGSDWDDQVEQAMVSADLMLVFVSPSAVASLESNKEWKYWMGEIKKPLIPVVIKDCRLPYRLYSLQRINAGDKPIDKLAVEIVSAIKKIGLQYRKIAVAPAKQDAFTNFPDSCLKSFVLKAGSDKDLERLDTLFTAVADKYRLVDSVWQRYIAKLNKNGAELLQL